MRLIQIRDGKINIRPLLINMIVVSWFSGFFLALHYSYRTVISIDTTFHLFLLFGVISTGIHYFFVREKSKKLLFQLAFFHFLGLAAIICGIFLLLNFHIRSKPYIEEYRIKDITYEYQDKFTGKRTVELENKAYHNYSYVLDFDQWSLSELESAQKIRITYARGIFGFKVILDEELVYDSW